MLHDFVESEFYQYNLVATLYMELNNVCSKRELRTYLIKVNIHPLHNVSFEEWMRKLIQHVNTVDTYFKEKYLS